MEFRFSGQINFDDYVRFNKFMLKNILLIRMVAFIITLIIVGIFSGIFDLKNGISFGATTIVMIFTFVLIVYMISIIFSKKRYKKMFKSNKTIGEKCDFFIDEKSMIISSESGSSILNEEKIYKIIIDKDSIYIFLAMNMAKIIKKRFFEDEEEYDIFVLFINENYKNKIKKK
jgi:predicted signal transduction protein with EAL and GGDEF domain